MKLFQIDVVEPHAMYCCGGWAVVRAESPEHALALLKAGSPGVVVDKRFDEPALAAVREIADDGGAGVLFCETYAE